MRPGLLCGFTSHFWLLHATTFIPYSVMCGILWKEEVRLNGETPRRTRTPQPNEQNGLVLHDDTAEQEINARKAQHVDDLSGCSGQFGSTADPAQRQCVAFPGINAPVPKEANQEKWGHRQSDLSAKVYHQALYPLAHSISWPLYLYMREPKMAF